MTHIEEFILELTALSKKHGVVIDGCGCCGSPDVSEFTTAPEAEAGYAMTDKLLWVSPSDEYYWKEYHEQIVREEENE